MAARPKTAIDPARDELPPINGVLSAEWRGNTWSLTWNGTLSEIHESLMAIGGVVTCSRTASLQEVFIARVGRDRLAVSEE